MKIQRAILIGSFGAAWMSLGYLNAQDSLWADKPPRLSAIPTYEKYFNAPAYWGLEIIGADLAKEELSDLDLKPARVVVSDSGVYWGAVSTIDGSNPLKPEDMSPSSGYAISVALQNPQFLPRDTDAKSLIQVFARLNSNLIHGSHVAGLIGAGGLGFGATCLAEVEDMNISHGERQINSEQFLLGLEILLERPQKTDVINLSHSLGVNPDAWKKLKTLAEKRDTLCVVASMNTGAPIPLNSGTASVSECLIVGNFSKLGLKDPDSSYGPQLDLVAPGDELLSYGDLFEGPEKSSLTIMSGSSMAAPLVSGAAAQLRAILPEASRQDIMQILRATAIDLGAEGRDDMTGWGLLNLYKATRVALKMRRAPDLKQALKNPESFELKDEVSETLKKLRSLNERSSLYARELRRLVLLQGEARGFLDLAKVYEAQGFSSYASGLRIMAYNRPAMHISQDDLAPLSKILADAQNKASKQCFLNQSTLMSIVHPELLLRTFEQLEDFPRSLSELWMRPKLLAMNPAYAARLDQMTRIRMISLFPFLDSGSQKKNPFKPSLRDELFLDLLK